MLKVIAGTIAAIGLVTVPALTLSSSVSAQTQRSISDYQNLRSTCRGEILNYDTVCKAFDNGQPFWYVINSDIHVIAITEYSDGLVYSLTYPNQQGGSMTVEMFISTDNEILYTTTSNTQRLLNFYTEDFYYILDAVQRGI